MPVGPNPTRSAADLPTEWRARAEAMRLHGAPDHARLIEHLASELDEALGAGGDELLTLKEAARASGYSADHLGSLVRKGVLENAGRSGSPRIRRSDLPHKDAKKPGRPHRASDADALATDFRNKRERKRKV